MNNLLCCGLYELCCASQVQFQLQQAPTDLLVVHAQQLQLLQQQQLIHSQQQQQQQQQNALQGLESKGANSKKTKAAKAKEAKLKAQELSPQSNEGAGADSGISSQSEASWQERAQVLGFLVFSAGMCSSTSK